jgi:hypothetical protein
MKKIFVLLSFIFLLNGCVESIAMLGTGASNGKMLQSSLNSAISYGVKKQTGKTPLGHALAYADEKNPEKKKEPCVAFIKKTNSEICAVVKKQITLTKAKLKKKELADNSSQKIASSLQPDIDKKFKIKYLDR